MLWQCKSLQSAVYHRWIDICLTIHVISDHGLPPQMGPALRAGTRPGPDNEEGHGRRPHKGMQHTLSFTLLTLATIHVTTRFSIPHTANND